MATNLSRHLALAAHNQSEVIPSEEVSGARNCSTASAACSLCFVTGMEMVPGKRGRAAALVELKSKDRNCSKPQTSRGATTSVRFRVISR